MKAKKLLKVFCGAPNSIYNCAVVSDGGGEGGGGREEQTHRCVLVIVYFIADDRPRFVEPIELSHSELACTH